MRSTQVALGIMVAMIALGSESAHAQVNQLNAGAGGAGGAAATGTQQGGTTGQGTTEGRGGVTGQGGGAAANQAVAGGNAAANFIGAQALESFVGGSQQNQQNVNRLFRSITGTQVPTGGNQNTSSTPRRVPISLRVAFDYPRPDASTLLIEPAGPPLDRIGTMKPELQAVNVTVDQAGVATLTGSAPDPAASRLAANLVRLRPGVREVRNQIQVGRSVPLVPQLREQF